MNPDHTYDMEDAYGPDTRTASSTVQEALVAAMAMALYKYNVSPRERADKLLTHFNGDCMEADEMLAAVDDPCWATVMPAPTALIYMAHAMDVYAKEAAKRVKANLGG